MLDGNLAAIGYGFLAENEAFAAAVKPIYGDAREVCPQEIRDFLPRPI